MAKKASKQKVKKNYKETSVSLPWETHNYVTHIKETNGLPGFTATINMMVYHYAKSHGDNVQDFKNEAQAT